MICHRLCAVLLLLPFLAGCAGGSSGIGSGSVEGAPANEIAAGPLTPEKLLNVVPGALSARLGAPGFKRNEPNAEIWQYGGSDCSLFVYFYKTEQGAFASTYVDARKRAGGAADVSACLASIPASQSVPVS